MGKFKDLLKKNDNSKLITVILLGMLILVIVMPLDSCDNKTESNAGNTAYKGNDLNVWSDSYSLDNQDAKEAANKDNLESMSLYYEERLKSILEKSYGQGTMEVMVNVKRESGKGLYGDTSEEFYVDGILVVAKVNDISKVADISNAVCALFDLPACKVAVLTN